MIKLSPEKLSLHFIWIFGVLEMITVPLVAWLPGVTSMGTKSPPEGAVVGFIGIVLLFFILNRVLRVLQLKLEDDTVTGISILTSALWNTLLLALLFGIQQAMSFISIRPTIIHQMISGFISTFGAVFITIFLYQLLGKIFIGSRITIKTTTSIYTITQFSILLWAILAGVYEAIALPVILIWQNVNSSPVLVAVLTGFAGGILGSSIVVICYNYFKFPRIYLFLEKTKSK
jgi:hypothetical protein